MTEHSPTASVAQSVSALTDNEASELDLARILKASDTDPEVKALWHRYHVARAAMHQDLDQYADPAAAQSFTARVSAALDEEATPRLTTRVSSWWANAGRLAVAASVAGAVIVGAQLYQQGEIGADSGTTVAASTSSQNAAPADAIASADVSLPAGFNAPPLAARPVSTQAFYESVPRRQVVFEPREAGVKVSEEQIRHYLNLLVESHTEHAAVNSTQGILPFARIPLVEEE